MNVALKSIENLDITAIKGHVPSTHTDLADTAALRRRLKSAQAEWARIDTAVRCGQRTLLWGPPGTGKTHLLAWIIIALVLHAQHRERPLRLAVSALTHQAIDGVLFKVAELVNLHRIKDFSARLSKWGRWREDASTWAEAGEEATGWSPVQVGSLHGSEEIAGCRHLVLGSTTFGLYRLFDSRTGAFPPVFDWIVFDEASPDSCPPGHPRIGLRQGLRRFPRRYPAAASHCPGKELDAGTGGRHRALIGLGRGGT